MDNIGRSGGAGPRTAPYGSWKSPISAALIVTDTVALGRIMLDGSMTYWAEQRPSDEGRNIIVRRTPDGEVSDVTPAQFDVGTAVHEYGARGYTVDAGVAFFSNANDQRLYRHEPGREPVAITPEGDLRYAAMCVDRTRGRVISVREDHTTGADEPVNTIVTIDAHGKDDVRILASGQDFYATPRLSADGRSLAWVAWSHPDMPWDGTQLWVAAFDDEGRLGEATLVSGGTPVAVAQPEWSPDGTLYFLSDASRWWNLNRWQDGQVEPVLALEAEFAKTFWWVGMCSYGFESASSLVCSYGRHGVWKLGRLDLSSKQLTPLDIPYTAMGWGDLKVAPGRVVFEAGSPSKPMSVLELDLESGDLSVLRTAFEAQIGEGYLSNPEPIEFPTENATTAHGFYYAPKNQDYAAPAAEKPPLLVTCHGGPTGAATMELELWTQYWTSRGIAVLDVNYGGSTGYGRDYRERLIGEWGVVDVDDSTNGARYLVARGDVDEQRLVISGGSAGGYTALAAMTFRDIFKAGASHFGVSDLESLLDGIHKFDTYSLRSLVGPYPLFRQRYVERSPINYSEQLSCPVIFFQGVDDTVVPADQSEMMFDVLRARGVPTAYIAFEGEPHGFLQAENIRRTLEAELYFYSRVFGFELADPVKPVHIENLDDLEGHRPDRMNSLEQAFDRIDQFAEAWIRERGIPGLAVAVTDREELLRVSTHGFADLAKRTSVGSDTLFEIGSLGKPFTSIAMLQLREEGKLDLDAPVSEYLPWFRVQSEYAPIKVHHLMNHTAGIIRGTDLAPYGLYDAWALRESKTCAPPGEYFWYSNLGYKTVGFLLETVTGQSLEEVVRSRVLVPLGMDRTHAVTTHETRKLAATSYCGSYDDRPEHRSHALVPALWSEYATGDGCEVSTAEDMAIYLRMLLNRGRGPRGRLLTEESFGLMTLDGIWTGGDFYGYGLATYKADGRTYIGHGGGNAGYRSAIVVDLEAGLGVVFLLNRMGETDPVVDAAQHALTLVRAAHRGEDLPPMPASLDATKVENAKEYQGTYRSGRRELKIAAQGGQLLLKSAGQDVALERRAPDSFYASHPDFDLFLLDFKRAKEDVVEVFHGGDWYVNERYSGPREFEVPQHWNAFQGHYRARNPELSNFRIVLRKGELALIIAWGTTEVLVPIGEDVFRIGLDPLSPETLQFTALSEGRALRADYSGCPYYRTFTR